VWLWNRRFRNLELLLKSFFCGALSYTNYGVAENMRESLFQEERFYILIFYDWKNMINDAKLFVKLRNGIAHPEEQTLTFWHVRYAISLHRRFCPKKLEHKIYRFSCLFSSFIWKNKVGYSYLLVKRNIKCLFFPFKHRFFCDSVVPRKRWPILAIHSKRCPVSTSCHSAVSEQSPKSNLNWKLYNRKLNIYCLKGYPFPWGSKN